MKIHKLVYTVRTTRGEYDNSKTAVSVQEYSR